jgi:hypothetical protein
MNLMRRVAGWPQERLAERVSAASYGTVLVLASLALIDADEVASGWGWELIGGVGLATYLAHLYAEVVGDRLRHNAAPGRGELRRAMADGLPILLAAVPPAVVLLLGRIGVLEDRVALWLSMAVALVQLVGLGGLVGELVSEDHPHAWRFAAAAGGFGLLVVGLKVGLGH